MTDTKGILITRTDRIGDLVLSLPVIRTLKKAFPREPLYLMVSSYAYPLLEDLPGISSIVKYENNPENPTDVSKAKILAQQISELNCRAALMLVYDHNVLNIIRKAGIKQRFGPLTRISGLFYYTKWLSQHRSKVEMHELEYNLELIKLLGVKETVFDYTLELPVPQEYVNKGEDRLKAQGFREFNKGYIVVHPGMGGSALNWKYSFYSELASRLVQDTKLPVIVTGSTAQQHITRVVTNHIVGTAYDTAGQLNLKELAGIISKASLFVGPSTGPLHIAAATGVPTVGIFSPVRVQSAKRWGPYSTGSITASPNLDCPGKMDCIGKRCRFYFCMDHISIEEVFEKAKSVMTSGVEQMSLKL